MLRRLAIVAGWALAILALTGAVDTLGGAGRVLAATFTVDDTGDASDASAGDGNCATAGAVCTLRAAIEEANALSGADSIAFGISGAGPHTITAATALPQISSQLSIDCATQSGTVLCTGLNCASAVWKIKISRGGGTNGGIEFGAGATNSTINGCEVADVAGSNLSGYGIILGAANSAATGNNVHDCWGGIAATANSAVVGGIGSDDANWSHANNFGLTVLGTGSILNNISGVAADGLSADGNASYGIYVEGGSFNMTAGNLSSGNGDSGIHVKTGVTGATLLNNLVGVNRTNTGNLCNVEPQIDDQGTSTTSVGNTEGDCAPTPTPTDTPAPTVQPWCINITPAFGSSCIDGALLGSYYGSEGAAATPLADLGVSIEPGSYVDGGVCDPDNAGSCVTVTPSPTPTPSNTDTPTNTATATPTNTAGAPPTVSDSAGLCRASGDKVPINSSRILSTTPVVLEDSTFVVEQAEDPWFFQCNVFAHNQENKTVQVIVTLREQSGLFEPQTRVVELGGGSNATTQINFQTWNITPGTYTIECLASSNKKNTVVAVAPQTYVGVWRLGSSAGGCPAGTGGLGTQVCLDYTLATSATAAVVAPTPLPAGAIVDTCLVETTAAITGGYLVGFAGAPRMFGKVAGTVGSSNITDGSMPDPVRIPGAESLRITSTHSSGSFQNTTGRAHAVCYCRQLSMPTATPTVAP